jgi:hypothetical protein
MSSSPAGGLPGALSPHPVKKRASTPHPKREGQSSDERHFLTEATKSAPDEFYSELATYVVRKPYTSCSDPAFWSMVGVASSNEYQLRADADKPVSIEVAAKINADGSILTLGGLSTVRHKKVGSSQWKIYEDVDEMDKPLGCVMYIDGDANEKEYWLGKIQICFLHCDAPILSRADSS